MGSESELKSNYMHIPKDASNSQFRGIEGDSSSGEWEYDDEVENQSSATDLINSRNSPNLKGGKTAELVVTPIKEEDESDD